VAGVLAAATVAAADCGADLDPKARRTVAADGVVVAFAPRPTPVRVGRHFALELAVCPAPNAAPAVDAEMPAHRHGMNYRARVERIGPAVPAPQARYTASGLMFHMPGHWRYLFDVDTASGRQRLVFDVDVE
jgi:hypothetical protein